MKIEPWSTKRSHFKSGKTSTFFFKLFEGPATYKVFESQYQTHKSRYVYLSSNNRLNVLNKLLYTFMGKFSLFGYSHPNTVINQSALANESRYFILYSNMTNIRGFYSSRGELLGKS